MSNKKGYLRLSASQSFTVGEIELLEFILNTLLRGSSPTMASRNANFAGLCRKTQAMKSRLAEVQQRRSVDGFYVDDPNKPGEDE